MAKGSFYADGTPYTTGNSPDYVVTFNGRQGAVVPATGDYSAAQITGLAASATVDSTKGSIEYVIDGGGFAVTAGYKGYLEIPCNCTITSATLLADQTGSAVVDLWRCSYNQYDGGATHPVAADTICAAAPPTISAGLKYQDTALSGWTTALTAGDILAFHVNSVATVQRLTLSLKVTRTT